MLERSMHVHVRLEEPLVSHTFLSKCYPAVLPKSVLAHVAKYTRAGLET